MKVAYAIGKLETFYEGKKTPPKFCWKKKILTSSKNTDDSNYLDAFLKG